MKAQVDVYHLILTSMAGTEKPEDPYPIADVSQRADRGHASVNGMLGTLASSTSLYDYRRQMFVPAKELFSVMGFPNVNAECMAGHEVASLMGNSMATPPLVLIFLPLLKALGMFVQEDDL